MAKKTKNNCFAYFLPDSGTSGVVESWDECNEIVKGKSGARYKGFKDTEEAKKWLSAGAKYENKEHIKKDLKKGIYFDAGTGRGRGVEISVTDETGKNLLHEVLSQDYINKYGKHWIFKEYATNNYGELLACKYALQVAMKKEIKSVFGDSLLVIDYWSRGRIKRNGNSEEAHSLSNEVFELRKRFESAGGNIQHVSGDINPADLGFHK